MRRPNVTTGFLFVLWGGLLVAVIVSLLLGVWSLAFVSAATLGLSVAPAVLASRLSLRLPAPFLIAITLFVIGSILMGEALAFYDRVWWWDLALHGASAIGFGLIGFLFIFMLFEGDRFAAPPAAVALLAFCTAVTVGALWEIFEFAMDQFLGFNMQKSGLIDTMGDLIVDAIGAFIAALSGYSYLTGHGERLFGPILDQFIDANRRLYRRARARMRR